MQGVRIEQLFTLQVLGVRQTAHQSQRHCFVRLGHVEAEEAHDFIKALFTEDAADLDLLGRLMLRTSARNQLYGKVRTIEAQGRNDLIELALADNLSLSAQITHDSTLRLELAPGATVVALIKAGWLELLAANAQPEAGYNCLLATVEERLDDAEGPSEVRLVLSNGQTLCALAEAEWLNELHATPGSLLQVQFPPACVLLGTPV